MARLSSVLFPTWRGPRRVNAASTSKSNGMGCSNRTAALLYRTKSGSVSIRSTVFHHGLSLMNAGRSGAMANVLVWLTH